MGLAVAAMAPGTARAATKCQTSGPSGGAYTITVCLDQPAGGATLTGDSTVSGSYTTSGSAPGVQRLVFYVDGQYAITDYQAPFTFSLPTTKWADGSHTIEVEALLRDGFTAARGGATVTFNNGITNPPPNTKQWAPTAGTQPGAGKPFVLAAVGDGAGGEPGAQNVVSLIKSWNPNLFAYLGDVYEKGSPTEFKNWYGNTASWFGQFRSITDPVVGNHEYSASPTAGGYFDYWDNIPHYYSYNANGWHVIALDSTSQFGQTAAGSPQYNWLLNDLKKYDGVHCKIAYWHHPPYNIGSEGYTTRMDEIWKLLVAHHLTVALTGHDHDYQRWVPLDGLGKLNVAGATEFVVGTGGHSEQSFVTTDSRVATSFSNTQFGALRMELNKNGAAYKFVTAAGQRLDSGSFPCNGAKDGAPPSAPTGLTATAKSRAEIDLSWNPSTDDIGVTGYDIYRNGSLLKSIGPDTTFADTTVAPKSTYAYTVKARDAKGTVSPASNSASATTPALSVLFDEGFESGDFSQWTTNNGMTDQQATVFAGSWSARAVNGGTNTATWVTKTLAAAQSNLYYQARVRVASQTTSLDLLRFRSSAVTPANLVTVLRTSTGKVAVRNETTGTTTTSKTSLAAGSWHALQMHVQVNGASSVVEVSLDGVKLTDVPATQSLGTTPIGRIDLGEFTKGRTYDAAFDDVAVDTNPIPDVTAPTVPSGLTATAASGLLVNLAWSASSDDVAVTGYDVFRNGVQIATTTGAATGYSDTTVTAESSYFYQVRARDGAGNTSALTDLATVNTPDALSDGFESGDLSQWTSSTGITVQSSERFSGTYAARATASLAPAWASKTLPAAPLDLYYRVRFKVLSQGATSPINLLRFRSATGSSLYTLSLAANGTLAARNDATGVSTSSTASVAPGAWHELQAHVLVQGATGQSNVWLDGTPVTAFSKLDNFGTLGIGRLELGDSTSGHAFDVAFDDVVAGSNFFEDDSPPTPPANLTANTVAGNQVVLSWTAATDNLAVTSYDVYRNGEVIDTIAPATGYTDTTVQPGNSYTYEVRANDRGGNTSEASNAITVTTPGLDTVPPSTPDGLAATPASASEVDLSWNDGSDNVAVTGYRIYRGGSLLTTVDGSTTSYADLGVAGDTTYTYTVQATDAAGNLSGQSGSASATTPHQALFSDGFETGDVSKWTVSGNVTAQQQDVASGAWAARATSSGTASWAWHQLPSPQTDVAYSLRFKSPGAWSGTTSLLKMRTATGTSLLGLQVSSTGKLGVRNDVAATTNTSSTTVSTGTWHDLQAHLVIAGASSTVDVMLDGTQITSLSKTENYGTSPVQRVQIGDNASSRTFDVYFDDVLVDKPAPLTPPANSSAPTIAGTAADGQTLLAAVGSWSGTTPISYAYQWRRCDSTGLSCADIAGAVATTYALASTDVGSTIEVRVTATNAAGSASADSAPTLSVIGNAPQNTALPAVSGAAKVGQTLTADNGTWSGTSPISYAYQWQSCDPSTSTCTDIPGATATTYVVQPADLGETLHVVVSATNSIGSAPATSADTSAVTAADAPPANDAPPSISGNAQDGQTLAADRGAWSGTAPISYGYQWRRCDSTSLSCGDIAGATATTYALTSADVGSTIVVRVTGTNAAGSSSADSAATAVVIGSAPQNASRPTISGAANVGQTLTADKGAWSGTAPLTFTYQWQSCDPSTSACADIQGANDTTYKVQSADVGMTLHVVVGAANSIGSTSATSADTGAVVDAGAAPANTAPPSISGTMLEGQTLTADGGSWSGAAPISYAYQWRHCNSDGSGCANVPGATAQTYVLSTADDGTTIDALVTATNAAGSSSARSATVSLRSPIFADGFETGALSKWTNFGLGTQQTDAFAGSWGTRALSTAGTPAYATANLPTPQSDLTYRLHFKGNGAWPSTGVYLLKLRTSANGSIVGVYVSGTGKLAYRNDVAATSTTSTTAVTSGAWHELDVHVTIGAAGAIDLVLDGSRVGGFPKTDNFGTNQVGKIQVGDNSTGRNFDVASDEVVVDTGG